MKSYLAASTPKVENHLSKALVLGDSSLAIFTKKSSRQVRALSLYVLYIWRRLPRSHKQPAWLWLAVLTVSQRSQLRTNFLRLLAEISSDAAG